MFHRAASRTRELVHGNNTIHRRELSRVARRHFEGRISKAERYQCGIQTSIANVYERKHKNASSINNFPINTK